MDERPFSDKTIQPSDEDIKRILNKSYIYYSELNILANQFKKEWHFSKSSGWMLKVHNGKKALFYLIPLNNSFIISLTLREQEKSEFISNNNLIELHNQIKNAKKYSEGFALKFEISDNESFLPLKTLIDELIVKRL